MQGLQTQLNILILLHSSRSFQKKPRKFMKKFSEALKTLNYFYLALARYYENEARMS